MVAIFTGAGTGFERGSGAALGAAGVLGSASHGRGGEQIYLNAANGNLLINRRDEFLVGRGQDAEVARTYNSLGDFSDDNGDNWRQSTDRRLFDQQNGLNTLGASIKRRAGDGSVVTYVFDGTAYVATDGAGAHDVISWDGSVWRRTDGDTRVVETYGYWQSDGVYLTAEQDKSGLGLSYSYSGNKLTGITTSNGERITYAWSGNNITDVIVSYINSANSWVDQTRTRYGYDGLNRLVSVAVDLTPEDNSTTDGNRYVTSYRYAGDSRLITGVSQSDGSDVSFGYDAYNRVVAISELVSAGVYRTTGISYQSGYTLITDATGQVTRLDYSREDEALPFDQWGLGNISRGATLIGNEVATRFAVSELGWPGVYQRFSANAGDTITWSFTVQADGSSNAHSFGLYNDNLDWAGDFAVARIVSGPGVLTQHVGGLWEVSGLSWSQATRIEITRHYSQPALGGAYFYVDTHYRARPGTSVRLTDPSISRSNTAVVPGSTDLAQWGIGNLSRTSAGSFSTGAGGAAYRLTVQQGGAWSGTALGLQANAGDTYSTMLTLKSTGNGDGHALGLYGNQTGWGGAGSSSARIISGPGWLERSGGGLWYIHGLSTTAETVVEVTRTFDTTEAGGAYFYPDLYYGWRAGTSVIAGGATIFKRTGSNMSGGQLTAITRPGAGGQPAQVTRFEYDRDGNLTTVIDPLGAASRYTYDTRGNLLTSTDRLGNVVTRTYNATNQLLTETRTASDATGAAVLQTTRYVYDDNNRLRFVISPEGRVTENWYDGPNLVWSFEYTGQFYNVAALGSGEAPSLGAIWSWRDSQSDPRQISQTWFAYDARGSVTQRVDYGAGYGSGNPQVHRGYTHRYFTYDQSGQLRSDQVAGRIAEQYRYDGLGRLVSTVDVNGGTTSYSYSDAASQTVITLASGQTTTTVYNKAGDVLSSTEAGWYSNTGSLSYRYDRLGRVRIASDARGQKSYFVYDERGRQTAQVTAHGGLTEYQYDQNDRLVGTIKYHLVNGGNGYPQWIWDALNNPDSAITVAQLRGPAAAQDIAQWSIYDAEGRVAQAIAGDGAVTNYDYDGAGRVVRTTQFATKLSAAQIAGFKGSPPLVVQGVAASGDDRVTRTFYDRDGNVIGALNAEGGFSRIIYDAGGRKVQDIAYELPVTDGWLLREGSLTHLADALSNSGQRTTRYVYDGQDNLRFTIDALGQVTELGYQYDNWTWSAFGPVRNIRVYANRLGTLGSYDLETVIASVASIASGADRISYNIYDDAARLVYSIDAGGQVTGYVYDVAGRVTREIRYADNYYSEYLPVNSKWDLDNWSASTIGNAANRVKRYYYAGRGELRFEIDAEGYVTRHDYDADERRVFSARWSGQVAATDAWTLDTVAANQWGSWSGDWYEFNAVGQLAATSNRAGQRTDYVYNATGTLAWEIRANGTGDEARVLLEYDASGRLVSRTEGWGTVEARTQRMVYDALGNQVQGIDGEGRSVSRRFDRVGRLVSETNAAGTTQYTYDTLGNLVRTIDARGNASYAYHDRLGRVIATRDAENYVTETRYTAFGEVASVTRRYNRAVNPAAIGALPQYDLHDKDATTSFNYDKLGRVIATGDAEGFVERKTYNAFGEVIRTQNKIGGIVDYSYDRRGLLTREYVYDLVYDGNFNWQNGFERATYQYNQLGRLTRKTEGGALGSGRTTSYVYNDAGQLIQERGDSVNVLNQNDFVSVGQSQPVTFYRYDLRGNLIEKIDPLGARTVYYYNDLDQKIAEVSAVGTLSTYAYDRSGNVVAMRVYATSVGQPAAGGTPPAVPGGAVRETLYTYDALNRRESESVTGVYTGRWEAGWYYHGARTVTTRYEYDALGNVVKTTDGTGAATYSYYDRASRKIAQVDAEGYLTRWTLDGEGNVLVERRYAVQTSGATVSAQPYIYDHYEDRITNFGYDRNGQRVYEQRLSVAAHALSGSALSDVSNDATIYYSYNGLGQVIRKTEATGEAIDYDYDGAGRLTRERRAGYTDHNGSWVRPTVYYRYNALGDLAYTQQGNEDGSGASRTTRYFYENGRLTETRDALEQQTFYYYDAAGNLVRKSYDRQLGSGGRVTDSQLITRDILGRAVIQGLATLTGSGWARTDTEYLTYNAFGELASRRLNSGASDGLAQEYFDYDAMGQLWRSNSGDGVWRYYVHDGAGRNTLTIESEGASIGWGSLEGAIAVATRSGSIGVGADYIDGINVTINRYDRRGLQVETILPWRELNTTSGPVTLSVGRSYNAFGEVYQDRDVRGGITTYYYTTTGRTKAVFRPLVNVTYENGATYAATPVDYYFYDIAGRLIGQTDANGRTTTRRLLAGTGYGNSEALVTTEYRADGSIATTDYDRFGDARVTTEGGRRTLRDYDALGRLTTQRRASGITDSYAYDILGQRIRQSNSQFLGAATTDYDAQGRVTREVSLAGIATRYSYNWYGHLGTAGMGGYGGWEKVTTSADERANIEQTDRFGRVIATRDQAGRWFNLEFDLAGRMVKRSGAGRTIFYHNLNTGRLGTITETTGDPAAVQAAYGGRWQRDQTRYGYDAAGNLTSEIYTRDIGEWFDRGYYEDYYYGGNDYLYNGGYIGSGGRTWVPVWVYEERTETLRNSSASYDALNRMTRWAESGNLYTPSASVDWSYDAVGNVRRVQSSYWLLNQYGSAQTQQSRDSWYRYDAMNRIVIAKGALSGGLIVRGSGTEYGYHADGQRAFMVTTASNNMARRDRYDYDADGNLATVWSQDSWTGVFSGIDQKRAEFRYDGLGRITSQSDYNAANELANQRIVTYSDAGAAGAESTYQRVGGTVTITETSNVYDILGNLMRSEAKVFNESRILQSSSTTTNSYQYFAGAVQSQVSYAQSGQATRTSYYVYNTDGVLTGVSINDGRPRNVHFDLDQAGQIMRRRERDNNDSQGDPFEIYYRFGGKQLGYTGNNGTLEVNYLRSVELRTTSPGNGAFRGGATTETAYADFDQSGVTPITSYDQGSDAGGYVVRAGDTLQGIAQQLWGDASLWYKLAQANGLSAGATLSAGQRLNLPSGVQRATFNATTLNPYDPASIIGDTSPTTPTPQARRNKCGIFGAILLAVVAIAVTIVTKGAAASFVGKLLGVGAKSVGALIGGGAIAAAAGSVASQTVGLITGIQNKFDWGAVGMAAIGGAVGGALGGGNLIGGIKNGVLSGVVNGAVRGLISNFAIQGIGVATGLQSKFDWTGVAAAAIGGAVGGGARAAFGGGELNLGQSLVVNGASAIANAAARSLIDGTSFGDNLIAALPDVISGTVGDQISNAMSRRERLRKAAEGVDEANGDAPGTLHADRAKYKAFREQQRALGRQLEHGSFTGEQFADLQRSALEPFLNEQGRQVLDQAFSGALAIPKEFGDPVELAEAVSRNGVASDGPDIAVVARKVGMIRHSGDPALGFAAVDRLALQGGAFAVNVGQALGPAGQLALTVLGYTLDALGGPAVFAARRVIDLAMGAAMEAAAKGFSHRFERVGYSPGAAALGGVGAVFLIGLAAGAGPLLKNLPKLAAFARKLPAMIASWRQRGVETAGARAASIDLVPVATKALGEWGEARLSIFFGRPRHKAEAAL